MQNISWNVSSRYFHAGRTHCLRFNAARRATLPLLARAQQMCVHEPITKPVQMQVRFEK